MSVGIKHTDSRHQSPKQLQPAPPSGKDPWIQWEFFSMREIRCISMLALDKSVTIGALIITYIILEVLIIIAV